MGTLDSLGPYLGETLEEERIWEKSIQKILEDDKIIKPVIGSWQPKKVYNKTYSLSLSLRDALF